MSWPPAGAAAESSRIELLEHLDKGSVMVSSCGRVVAACGQQCIHVCTHGLTTDVVESPTMWGARLGRMLFRTVQYV